MKIAFNTLPENPSQPTGSFDFFIQLTRELSKCDEQNQYIVFGSQTNKRFFANQSDRLLFQWAGFSNENRLLRILSEQVFVPFLLWWRNIDIYFTSSGGGIAPIFSPKRTRIVVAAYATQQFQGKLKLGFWRTLYRKLMFERSLKKAWKIVVNSESCRQDILRLNPALSKIKKIYHGFDLTPFQLMPAKDFYQIVLKKYAVQKPFILFVSTIWRYKNVETLIKAFADLLKTTKENVTLVLIGRMADETYGTFLQDLGAQLKIATHIKWLGRLDEKELFAFYRSALVYVQPSLYETFGKTVVEAFAAGCPVIGTSQGATPEIIDDGGLIFQAGDSSQLAHALKEITLNADLRNSLIKKGHKRASLFSLENEIEGFLEVFNEQSPQ